ncbi:macrolide 2'-phosphotransferase [Paenibacillus arenilitoris]|uniref:Macrolide 2'-phosphotransferase n=1 Tax=Paenibacillus arenilitoris TaxID=2772299 RepID=A0A927CMQ8_9BACL|nr:macrolide 2'-phosphotransferase [Paenibacillus arenilitoris]MBD2870255.1 macrolide 2'-phosphotransferase [Paenibacillus arenilitoris]
MTTLQPNEYTSVKQQLLTAAAAGGLRIEEDSLDINESGMDFLVAFAKDAGGARWVLRKPRRADVLERAENEYKVLKLVREQLPIDAPDWRIFTPELIAYPLLGGKPVATVDPAAGGYAWLYEQHSLPEAFFDSFAEALAALHRIDHGKAAEAGLRVKSPLEARQAFADVIEEVKQHFAVPAELLQRWTTWLARGSYWPDYSVLNHGDMHPPHILIDEHRRVTGFQDWTEAEVGDPGKDFVIFYALFGEEGLRDLLKRYEKAGGRVWPTMHEHIAEQWAAYPAMVAKFALMTGKEADMEMAKAFMGL